MTVVIKEYKYDNDIINVSNEIESSDISEHSDTNSDENFKNGVIRCNNVYSDNGDEQSINILYDNISQPNVLLFLYKNNLHDLISYLNKILFS